MTFLPGDAKAPFDAETLVLLRRRQADRSIHPMTCSRHTSKALIVKAEGLRCRVEGCSYTQDWAPALYMIEADWLIGAPLDPFNVQIDQDDREQPGR